MTKGRLGRTISGNLVLTTALLLMFCAASLTLALSAAQAFKTLESDKGYISNLVVAASYLNTKIRQNDCENAISIRPIPPTKGHALVITEVFDSEVYETWIYWQDGELREAFIMEGDKVTKHTSSLITPLDGFDLSFDEPCGKPPKINIDLRQRGFAKQKSLNLSLSLRAP